MRPGQNKRMRGRPSNNRRGPNPLTRSYESNGPDVKIRGNAHHVAEKYLQLARDAHTGGDPVAAENYLQHAEHYFRLIASAQAAQQVQAQGGAPRAPNEAEVYEFEDDDDFGGLVRPLRFARRARSGALHAAAAALPAAAATQSVRAIGGSALCRSRAWRERSPARSRAVPARPPGSAEQRSSEQPQSGPGSPAGARLPGPAGP